MPLPAKRRTGPENTMNKARLDLGDPQWELIDPTPNVHTLFVQFNAEFFWGKLGSVSLRWSKRMYSCAGICRYEGRGGLCDIGLSEPLLKLRPRKDIIETLLHEMIHAFLFLTERDRDRDGHGPNFQEHMHRINRAANINITVYHSFHDEVKLYQTHWWRCNGLCQTQKPFFGVVRRSSNRAPGPNDFWWQKHQTACGGQFIKIKEPDKKNPVTKPKENIIKYLNTTSNIKTLADVRPSLIDGSTKPNGAKTVVMTDKKSNTRNTSPAVTQKTIINMWSGKGNTLETKTGVPKGSVARTVRDHWANKTLKEVALDSATNMKRRSTSPTAQTGSPPAKITKIDIHFPTTSALPEASSVVNTTKIVRSPPPNFSIQDAESLLKDIYGESFTLNKTKYSNVFSSTPRTVPVETTAGMKPPEFVDCPSCSMQVQSSKINDHLDTCTEVNDCVRELVDCPLCCKKITSSEINEHACALKEPDLVECPSCGKRIKRSEINDHLDVCLLQPKHETVDLTKVNITAKQGCPICNAVVPGSLEEHLVACLKFFDNAVPKCSPSKSSVLSTRVDEPISLIEEDDDEFNDSSEFNASGTMHPCPCCLKMVEADLMNSHIDECLNAAFLAAY